MLRAQSTDVARIWLMECNLNWSVTSEQTIELMNRAHIWAKVGLRCSQRFCPHPRPRPRPCHWVGQQDEGPLEAAAWTCWSCSSDFTVAEANCTGRIERPLQAKPRNYASSARARVRALKTNNINYCQTDNKKKQKNKMKWEKNHLKTISGVAASRRHCTPLSYK